MLYRRAQRRITAGVLLVAAIGASTLGVSGGPMNADGQPVIQGFGNYASNQTYLNGFVGQPYASLALSSGYDQGGIPLRSTVGYSNGGPAIVAESYGSSFPVLSVAAYGGGVSGASIYSGSGNGVNGTSFYATGLSGFSTNNAGVVGSSGSYFGTAGFAPPGQWGVYGQGGGGVRANSPYGWGLYADTSAPRMPSAVIGAYGNPSGYAAELWGDLVVNGDTYAGSGGCKCAALPDAQGVLRKFHAIEAPEPWLEDFGTGQVVNGRGRVNIDPNFAQYVRLDHYQVFLTPLGDTRGLYVSGKSPTGFDVLESAGGTGTMSFDWRIVAKRADISGERLQPVPTRAAPPAVARTVLTPVPTPARPPPSPTPLPPLPTRPPTSSTP